MRAFGKPTIHFPGCEFHIKWQFGLKVSAELYLRLFVGLFLFEDTEDAFLRFLLFLRPV